MKMVFDWTDEEGEQNDEVCKISLVGAVSYEIITVNHDEHGWAGMEAVTTALKRVAEVTWWSSQIIGEEGV